MGDDIWSHFTKIREALDDHEELKIRVAALERENTELRSGPVLRCHVSGEHCLAEIDRLHRDLDQERNAGRVRRQALVEIARMFGSDEMTTEALLAAVRDLLAKLRALVPPRASSPKKGENNS